MYKLSIHTLVCAAALLGAVHAQAAPVYFDWVCSTDDGATTTACPYGLKLTLGFKQSVIDDPGNTFTGMDSMLEALSFSSTFGKAGDANAGFTTLMADLTGADNAAEKLNFQVVFDATRQKIMRLNDASSDQLLWVGFAPAPGAIRFSEGTGQSINPGTNKDYTYSINRIQDANPFAAAPAPTAIDGLFVRRAAQAVSEPPGLGLTVTGLVALAWFSRQRTADPAHAPKG